VPADGRKNTRLCRAKRSPVAGICQRRGEANWRRLPSIWATSLITDFSAVCAVSWPGRFCGPIDKLQGITGSYGIAIILFTIFIYSLFFPLKWQSSRKMKKAQKYAPRMKELQEKLKSMKQSDPRMKELQMEQLRLMKEANPLGGCLPLMIQMPFLFALYTAITISIDFRQASFLWIPDLSSPEPYFLYFLRLLPILFHRIDGGAATADAPAFG
jgi:YidC/Oxa1 family membrane protein insertase